MKIIEAESDNCIELFLRPKIIVTRLVSCQCII